MGSAASGAAGRLVRTFEAVGRASTRGLEFVGFGASLLGQSLYWLVLGRRERQPVRVASVAAQAMDAGIRAIPIVTILSVTIGIMLALQGIDALKPFGAQAQVTLGVSLSVTREFAALITGIIVAGRSGSSLAARLGTMSISNEVDALRVMGINPVRFLVAPPVMAMAVMVPALALWANFAAFVGAGAIITGELGIAWGVYVDELLRFLEVGDVMHGLSKAAIFGVLIAIVGVINGASARGGAEGVGRVTTSAVVQSITAIVLADMIFVFAATR